MTAKSGTAVLLKLLESQGRGCIFASPIAVMAPVWEAIARHGNDMKHPKARISLTITAIAPRSANKISSQRDSTPATT